jgi:hypothetical protein
MSRLDILLFWLLLLSLGGKVISSGMANIQTDAIDYYAILQRLIGDDQPIVDNLPFVEQRSPGYPMISLPAYAAVRLASSWITPETVKLPPPSSSPEWNRPSEEALLPPQTLRVRDMFFKNFDLAPQGGWFKWDIMAALLITSYGLFFSGLFASGKTLLLLFPAPAGISLVPLLVVTAPIFMHNLLNIPAYASLAVFGLNCWFAYFWVRGWQSGSGLMQLAAGLLAGLLALTRLETVLIVAVLALALVLNRKYYFLRQFILGGLIPLALLAVYNATQFGNLFHTAILKGGLNKIAFHLSFIWFVLANPRSGILIWSALAVLGIIGLFFNPSPALKALGWACLALIALIAVRVPVMYSCVGQGTQIVSGLSITCPPDRAEMLSLIRFDSNRYVIPLVPFAALGLRGMVGNLSTSINKESKNS